MEHQLRKRRESRTPTANGAYDTSNNPEILGFNMPMHSVLYFLHVSKQSKKIKSWPGLMAAYVIKYLNNCLDTNLAHLYQ